MFELKVITHFAAAHQLKLVAEKCENLHGHNWKIEIFIAGDRLNNAGVLIDFGIVKSHLSEIMDRLDHKYLNDLPFFKDLNPSSERIAIYISDELDKKIKAEDSSLRVSRVTSWESEDACATYIRPEKD